MNRKIKTKEATPKTTQTAPIPSESTKIFEKRITGSTRYWLPHESPYPTKHSMSSKDWSEMSKRVDSLLQGKEDLRSKKIPSKFKF